MGFVERANWPDIDEALRLCVENKPVGYPQAIHRYMWAPGPRRAGESALDAGCGSGQGALVLHAKGYAPVHSVDKFPGAGAMLRAKGLSFYPSPLADFAPPQTYDLVACCDVMEHVAEPERILRNIHGWLAQGGRFYVTVPLEGTKSPNPFHLNAWTQEAFCNLLDACGFALGPFALNRAGPATYFRMTLEKA